MNRTPLKTLWDPLLLASTNSVSEFATNLDRKNPQGSSFFFLSWYPLFGCFSGTPRRNPAFFGVPNSKTRPTVQTTSRILPFIGLHLLPKPSASGRYVASNNLGGQGLLAWIPGFEHLFARNKWAPNWTNVEGSGGWGASLLLASCF